MQKIFFTLTALLLSACVGTSPTSQFYTMRTTDVSNSPIVSEKITASIGIEPVKIPYMLDRPQMVVVKQNDIEVSISERHRWAEPLSNIVARKLVGDLALALPKAQIRNKSFALEKFDYSVMVEITTLQATFDDKISLEAWYSITDKNGKVVKQQKFSLSKPVGDTYENLVLVESQIMEELALNIAQTLSKLK